MPYALSIGVDYQLFWHLNPTKLKAFNKAFEISYERRMRERETLLYIGGIYNAKAISTCFSKNAKYPEKPIRFFDFSEKKEPTEEEIKLQREKLIASLQLMQANFEASKIN